MRQNTSTINCPENGRAAAGEWDMPPAKRLVAEAVDGLATALAAGQSGQLKDYLAMLGRFHQYSLANVLLIAMQCPRATHVAGCRTWQGLGRQVRRGEHAIQILLVALQFRLQVRSILLPLGLLLGRTAALLLNFLLPIAE